MADSKAKLDTGFEEVPLDTGFQDVPIEQDPSILQGALETGEDASRAFLEETTLGGLGEISGAVRAGGEKLLAGLTGQEAQDFLDLYKKYREEEEAKIKMSAERSPTASAIGGVAGMVLPGLATAGSGLVAGGAKAAIGQAVKGGGFKALGKLMGKGAASGAALGGAQALGKSEESLLEDPMAVGEDVLSGAEAGAVFGGALPLVSVPVGKLLGKLKQKAGAYAERSPFVRQTKLAFEKGRAGEIIEETDPYRTKVAREQTGAIEGLTTKILEADEALGKTFGQIIDDATAKGTQISLGEQSVSALSSVNNLLKQNEILQSLPEAQKFKDALGKILSGNPLSPREAFDLKKYVGSLKNKIDVPGLKAIAGQLENDIDGALSTNVQGFKQVNELFAKFRSSVPETLMGGQKMFGELAPRARQEKLKKAVTRTYEGIGMPGEANRETQRKFTKLMDNVQELEKTNPGLLESLGLAKSPTAFEQGIRGTADEFALTRQALGFEPQSGITTNLVATATGSPATTGRGLLLDYSNRLGNVTKLLKPSADVGRKLYSAPESVLQAVGKQLEGSGVPGLSNLGTSLIRGLTEKNSAMKNAVLFSLMQNPEARLMLNKFIPQDEKSE